MGSLSKFSEGGNFLRKEDVPQPIVVTIVSTGEHQFEGDTSPKLVLHFQEPVKAMLVNKTNAKLLQHVLGVTETEQLLGKRIEIYVDPMVPMRGQIVGGLRIRAPQQPGQPAVAPQQTFAQLSQPQTAYQGPAPSPQQTTGQAEQAYQNTARQAPW